MHGGLNVEHATCTACSHAFMHLCQEFALIVEGARVRLALLTAPCPADMSGVQMLISLEASISKHRVWGHVRLSST